MSKYNEKKKKKKSAGQTFSSVNYTILSDLLRGRGEGKLTEIWYQTSVRFHGS